MQIGDSLSARTFSQCLMHVAARRVEYHPVATDGMMQGTNNFYSVTSVKTLGIPTFIKILILI